MFEKLEDKGQFDQFVDMYVKLDGNETLGNLLHRLFNIVSTQSMNDPEGDAGAIFSFIVTLNFMIDKYNPTGRYIDDMVSGINSMNDVKSATEKLLEDHAACENGNKIFSSVKNCFVDVRKGEKSAPTLEMEEVGTGQPQQEPSPARPWWKTALIGAGIGLFAVAAAVAGLALGIPALLVTVAGAIVIGAVAGAAMLIGFGIGAIVGKVREKQEQRQYQYVAINNEDGNSPRNNSVNTSTKKTNKSSTGLTKLWKDPIRKDERDNDNNKEVSQHKFKK